MKFLKDLFFMFLQFGGWVPRGQGFCSGAKAFAVSGFGLFWNVLKGFKL